MTLQALFDRLHLIASHGEPDFYSLIDMQCEVERHCLNAMRRGIVEPAVSLDVRAMLATVGRLLAAVEPADVLTVAQAAERLGVSIDSVYDLCKSQRLKHLKVGRAIRIHPADLDAFVADSTRAPASRGLRCLR